VRGADFVSVLDEPQSDVFVMLLLLCINRRFSPCSHWEEGKGDEGLREESVFLSVLGEWHPKTRNITRKNLD